MKDLGQGHEVDGRHEQCGECQPPECPALFTTLRYANSSRNVTTTHRGPNEHTLLWRTNPGMSIRSFPVVLKNPLPSSIARGSIPLPLNALSRIYVRFFGMQIETKKMHQLKHIILILRNSEPASNVIVASRRPWKQGLPRVMTLPDITIDFT
jgi:hypothetical protein